jgi:uncharacterized protein (DUF2236 family)
VGYFSEDAAIRLVHRERIVALSGPRALLMQAAHPLAVTGLLAHSSALEEPYERLARTARAMNAITFGSRAEALAMGRMIRAMHRRVSGVIPTPVGRWPAGTPALVVYSAYVGPLSRVCEEELWADYRALGRLFGLAEADMPLTLDDLGAYRQRMLYGDELYVTDWARRRARKIVLSPPVPLLARPALETANFITIALLPDPIRRQYGFSPVPPTLLRKRLVAAGASYVRHVVLPLTPPRLRFGSRRTGN